MYRDPLTGPIRLTEPTNPREHVLRSHTRRSRSTEYRGCLHIVV